MKVSTCTTVLLPLDTCTVIPFLYCCCTYIALYILDLLCGLTFTSSVSFWISLDLNWKHFYSTCFPSIIDYSYMVQTLSLVPLFHYRSIILNYLHYKQDIAYVQGKWFFLFFFLWSDMADNLQMLLQNQILYAQFILHNLMVGAQEIHHAIFLTWLSES